MSKRVNNFNKHFASYANKQISINEALSLLKEYKEKFGAKFNETVDVSFDTALDPTYADQNVKTFVDLPNSHKIQTKAIVFKRDFNLDAKFTDRVLFGSTDVINDIANKKVNLDVYHTSISTSDMMKSMGKVMKKLATKKILPNPKFGTVVEDVESVLDTILNHRVFLSNDKFGSFSVLVGNLSDLSIEDLEQNINAVKDVLSAIKPAKLKGKIISSMSISSSMGPGFKIAL